MPKTKQFEEAAVLQKAGDVFWEKGYNGTSMDELVAATGLSRSSIYDTFGDKHGLYLKALAHYQQSQQAQMEQWMPPNIGPRKKIELFLQKSANASLSDNQQKGCFILNTTTELANVDDHIKDFVANNMVAMEALLLEWVKEGQSSGQISKRFTAKAIARHLFSTLNGLKVVAQIKADKAALQDIVKLALSVLD
jgi:TetR/AcrR family transcriptional regulator, transcriptional repressor for nem operon